MPNTLRYPVQDLNDYIVRFFTRLGVSPTDAQTAARVILAADLRGVDSHGVIRLHSYYGSRLLNGRIDPRAVVKVLRETPVTLALDGGNGLGQVVGEYAMRRCIEKARANAIGMVTVRCSNHYGIAGYYAMMALEHNLIGVSFTNSQPLVAPTHGRTRLLGTNPIAVAVPAGKHLPYVLDMATSIVPIGRIAVYEKMGQPVPLGWGLDENGVATSDPRAIQNGGALFPLGGPAETRGYKGYGLSLLVDLFCGVLAGAAIGPEVGDPSNQIPSANVGHFFAAIDISAFRDLQEFQQEMDRYIELLKNAPKAAGEERIYIHGEKEFEIAEVNQREGIPLLPAVVDSLREAGALVGEPFDLQPLP
ncbi:MAG: Ldh family oxidoreductase [Chloroflexi bacterium]|nr:Ldh family oxidoreductase [Chloroflexota bacterium]